MREALEKLGLAKNEAEVYLALLEIGQTTTGAIIKKLGIHRNIVYESLDKLEKKGLVTKTIMSGKMHFQITSPEKLLEIEKERIVIAQNVVTDLKKIQRKEKQEITVHQGIKEMKDVKFNIMKESPRDSTVYYINAVGKKYFKAVDSFKNKLEELRNERNIHQKLLVSAIDYNECQEDLKKTGIDMVNSEWKSMPSDFRSPASTLVYLDKVIFQILSDPENPTLISIKNKDLADSYKAYFEMLWDQEVKIFRGVDGVFNVFDQMLDDLSENEGYFVLGANWGWQKPEIFAEFTKFHKKRKAKGIKGNLLFISGSEKTLEKYKDNYKGINVKFLPSGIYDGIQINLYKNKAAIIVWRKDEPVCFVIEDEIIYKTFKTYFDTLWEQTTTQFQGKEGVEKVIELALKSKKEFRLMGANGLMLERYPDLFEKMEKGRLENGTKRINLAVEKVRGKKFVIGPGVEARYLPDDFDSPTITWLFDNKFVNIVWTQPEIVTIVEDQGIVDGYMKRFNYLWSIAKD